jgi:hypothetical protein
VVRPGDVVADLGAGSAVLAIAAAKLGAARVAAIEFDPDAIENAEDNVRRNGVADRVTVIEGDATVLLPLVARCAWCSPTSSRACSPICFRPSATRSRPTARRSSAASSGRSARTCSPCSRRTAGGGRRGPRGRVVERARRARVSDAAGGTRPTVASFVADAAIAEGAPAVALGADAAHHARVRRLEPGEAVTVRDGAGAVADGVIRRIAGTRSTST